MLIQLLASFAKCTIVVALAHLLFTCKHNSTTGCTFKDLVMDVVLLQHEPTQPLVRQGGLQRAQREG